MINSKRAQIQSMETIAVVIIIAILIIFGIVFSFSQRQGQATKQQEETQATDALTVSLRASGLKEIKCSTIESSGNACLDYYKLLAFSERITIDDFETYSYYYDLFRRTDLIIKPIYPPRSYLDITLFKYNTTQVNVTSAKSTFFPILVYDPYNEVYIFSIMEVRAYS